MLCITFFAFNLLTRAESPVLEKQEQKSKVEYTKILKYKRPFLRNSPYPLTPDIYPLKYVKGRMVRLNSSGDVGGSNKVLQDAVYSFNPNNNITSIANNTTDFNTQYDYGYDGLGRLTNATGSYLGIADGNLSREFQQSFSYAKNGNLTAKRIHDPASGAISDEWSYQYTNHQVTNIDSSKSGNDAFVMQYDASGNLTRQRDNARDLTKRISVDSQDRITQIQDGNNAVLGSYWYDESGFRIRKSSLEPKNNVFSNVEILYPSKFFGLEFIESENVISSVNNVYLNGVRIAALNEAGALAYYLTDQVDSVSLVLDDEGKTLSKMQYLPYGETFVQRGDTNFAPKYNSQELDRESGFYFYNARFYDPGIARFTSADTLIPDEYNSQSWNRFSYVNGNPIQYKDPTGHAPQDENAGFKDASKNIAKGFVEGVKSALSAPTPVDAAVNSAVATAKGAKELYENRKEVYASVKDFAGKLTSKDDKVRDYAVGQAKAYTMSAVLGGAASKAIGSRLPKPKVDVPGGGGGKAIVIGEGMGAVKETAKNLQSQGVNAKWYQAWGKNFPKDREMTPKEMSSALGRNEKWLNSKMKDGYKIYDIGPKTNQISSPFYKLEKTMIDQSKYTTTKIPRP
ncbi:RHS repeat domain-containing protein [Leptospira weilii]|uniref:RHS repeat domain-containing protein n=2 Tax=Leptospira weilii TaxID=28184 RepID=UPI001EF26060|nr:RHS repeat-associated core domain-containing protein [Leptospira weilii]ULH30836.1 polymorphic toxin type 10 domain-containing protein [Leptospira weilii]